MPVNIGFAPPNVYLGNLTPASLTGFGPGNNLIVSPTPGEAPSVATFATPAQSGGSVIEGNSLFITNTEFQSIHAALCQTPNVVSATLGGKGATKSAVIVAVSLWKAVGEGLGTCSSILALGMTIGEINVFPGFDPDGETDPSLIDRWNEIRADLGLDPVTTVTAETLMPPPPVPVAATPVPGLPPPEEEEPPPPPAAGDPTPPAVSPPATIEDINFCFEQVGALSGSVSELAGQVMILNNGIARIEALLAGLPTKDGEAVFPGDLTAAPIISVEASMALPVIAQLISDGNFLLSQENALLKEQLLILEELRDMGTIFAGVHEFPGWRTVGPRRTVMFTGGYLGGTEFHFVSDRLSSPFIVREITFFAGNDGIEYFTYNYGFSTSDSDTAVFGTEIVRLFHDPTQVKDVLVGIGRNFTISANILVPDPGLYLHATVLNNDLTFQIGGMGFSIEEVERVEIT